MMWFKACLFVFFSVSCLYATACDGKASVWVEVVAYPSLETVVSVAVSGLVQDVFVKEGAKVKKGDQLAVLDSQEELLDVKRLEKVLEKKVFDSRGIQKLLVDDMTSRNEALQAKLEKEISELELSRARLNLSRKKLGSPLDGEVVKIHHQTGEWIPQGRPFFEIIDISKIHAVVLLDSSQAGVLKVGQQVGVFFPEPGPPSVLKTFQGKVIHIDPRFDLSSGLKSVKIEIPNPKDLINPGMRGRICLESK